ncbi:hypothetical protein HDU89_005228 [Geranomyces variabilis]|nr:hypothetical protein HDU89_005228 [Geranomyces variabilis]
MHAKDLEIFVKSEVNIITAIGTHNAVCALEGRPCIDPPLADWLVEKNAAATPSSSSTAEQRSGGDNNRDEVPTEWDIDNQRIKREPLEWEIESESVKQALGWGAVVHEKPVIAAWPPLPVDYVATDPYRDELARIAAEKKAQRGQRHW